MIAAVSPAPMVVRVSIVAREQAFEQVVEVHLGAAAYLHQREPGGGVRREDVDEPVTPAPPGEVPDPVGQVGDPSSAGRDLK
jgi:hypothetical protein